MTSNAWTAMIYVRSPRSAAPEQEWDYRFESARIPKRLKFD